MHTTANQTMDTDQRILHMAGGVGDTSYAKNSMIQKKAADFAKTITLQTIQQAYNLFLCRKRQLTSSNSFGIADLGCGSGNNTLSIIKEMLEACVHDDEYNEQTINNEFRVCLNDLPNNDFNTIFKALPDFYTELGRDGKGRLDRTYICAYSGSFYGRLFPDKSLHFIYSNNSLHWLSKVPQGIYDEQNNSINKGNIYISESSPLEVAQAYFCQFQEDFSLFLRSRSKEVVAGGRMVLIVSGRSGRNHDDRGITLLWTLLSKSLALLVSQGPIEEEKLDTYDVPFYAPSEDEIRDEVRRDGSFEMDCFEIYEIDKVVDGGASYGTLAAKTVKAVQGPMICQHFGEGVLDSVFENYGRLVDEEMAIEEIRPIYFVFVLRKL